MELRLPRNAFFPLEKRRKGRKEGRKEGGREEKTLTNKIAMVNFL